MLETGALVFSISGEIAAAAIIACISFATWYFFNHTVIPAVAQQQSSAAVAKNKTEPDPPSTSSITVPDDEQPVKELAQKSPEPITRYSSQSVSGSNAYYLSDYTPIATTYAGLHDEQAIHFSTPPTIAAPLIRDECGQIILDKNLITSPDDCYITITGPNGEQTRISSKFVHIISSLNADTEPPEY